MFENIKVLIKDIDTDVLITFIIGLSLIFFGISNDIRNKNFRLKNILIIYISLFLILIFFGNITGFILLTLSVYLAGGIIFLHDKDNELEKEMNLLQLLRYYSRCWFYLNKTYIWIICTIVISVIHLSLPSNYTLKEFTIKLDYIELITIFAFLIYHYISVAKCYFDFHNFSKMFQFLKISYNSHVSTEDNENITEKYKQILNTDHIELLTFVLFMEDKNMFKRSKNKFTFTDIKNSRTDKQRNSIFFKNLHFNTERKGIDKLKTYLRGYSTIEQQYIRQRALGAYSYKYTFRRKRLIEACYTTYFCKALCKRCSLHYHKGFMSPLKKWRQKRKIMKDLNINLKLHFLISYYINVLDSPENAEVLLNNMSKNSRVSKNRYKHIFDKFKDSTLSNEYKNQILEASKTKYKFLLLDK